MSIYMLNQAGKEQKEIMSACGRWRRTQTL